MDLSLEEKEILSELGYPEADIPQIEAAMRKDMTAYSVRPLETGPHQETAEAGPCRRVSREEAIALLGKRRYLAGLGRSAFHWSAAQHTEDGKAEVYFDSGRLFK